MLFLPVSYARWSCLHFGMGSRGSRLGHGVDVWYLKARRWISRLEYQQLVLLPPLAELLIAMVLASSDIVSAFHTLKRGRRGNPTPENSFFFPPPRFFFNEEKKRLKACTISVRAVLDTMRCDAAIGTTIFVHFLGPQSKRKIVSALFFSLCIQFLCTKK